MSVDAAIASIRFLLDRRDALLEQVERTSDYFRTRLSQMRLPRPATTRIKGLAMAIEFDDSDAVEKLRDKCRRNGLLVSAEGEYLMMLPALTIDLRIARKGLDIFEKCVAR